MVRFEGQSLLIATHNSGKFDEFSSLLEPMGISAVAPEALSLNKPVESEDTFAGNARIKAHYAAGAANMVALADDSGLMVDALDGAPGVYTADWAQTDNGRDFTLAMGKVWAMLEANGAPEPRAGRFCCTLCLAWPDGGVRFSKVTSTAGWFGPSVELEVLALIRCFCLMAMMRPLVRRSPA